MSGFDRSVRWSGELGFRANHPCVLWIEILNMENVLGAMANMDDDVKQSFVCS